MKRYDLETCIISPYKKKQTKARNQTFRNVLFATAKSVWRHHVFAVPPWHKHQSKGSKRNVGKQTFICVLCRQRTHVHLFMLNWCSLRLLFCAKKFHFIYVNDDNKVTENVLKEIRFHLIAINRTKFEQKVIKWNEMKENRKSRMEIDDPHQWVWVWGMEATVS